MSTASNRKSGGGSGSLVVGTTPIVSGEVLAILREDAAGLLVADADTLAMDSSGRLSIGRATPLSSRQGSNFPLVQVHGTTAGDGVIYSITQNSTSGYCGLAMESNSGAIAKIFTFGSAGLGTSLRANAASMWITADNHIQFYTTGAGKEIAIGGNTVEQMTFKGDTTGIRALQPITNVPTALAGAAIATTGTIGVPAYQFSAPGAARTFVLPAIATLPMFYPIMFAIDGSIGGFAITLDGNAAETVDGAATNATLLAADNASCCLIRVTGGWISLF
jgi:hypothetical protein